MIRSLWGALPETCNFSLIMRKHATNPRDNIFCRVTGQAFCITEFMKDKESLLNGPRWEGMKPGLLNAASAPGFYPGAKGVSGKTRGILVLFSLVSVRFLWFGNIGC